MFTFPRLTFRRARGTLINHLMKEPCWFTTAPCSLVTDWKETFPRIAIITPAANKNVQKKWGPWTGGAEGPVWGSR